MLGMHDIPLGSSAIELSRDDQAAITGGDSLVDILLKALVNYCVNHSDDIVNGFADGYEAGRAG